MTKIFLIRHGETEWNSTGRLQGTSDVQLSAVGIRQAQLLAEHAPFQSVDAIYSSNLIRACSTAEILAEPFNLSVKIVPELHEAHFGDWEGQPIKILAETAEFGNFFTAPEKCRPPHGETFAECQARVVDAIRKIVAENDGKQVIIVSHGAVIRLFLCSVLEMPINKIWRLSQFNTAVNILRVDDGNFTIELLNGTFHLQNL